MCIMQVRPGQHSITIMQACAHNANTVRGDLEMFDLLAKGRNEDEIRRVIHEAQVNITRAYAAMLGSFGEQLAADLQNQEGHWNSSHTEHDHGNERPFSEVIDAATRKAHDYETR